jgi:hypothetical protein
VKNVPPSFFTGLTSINHCVQILPSAADWCLGSEERPGANGGLALAESSNATCQVVNVRQHGVFRLATVTFMSVGVLRS